MARILPFKYGDRIIKAGSREKIMYIIMEGEVRVELEGSGVSSSVEVARLGKGDFIGEISFFSEQPRSAHVTACTDGKLAVIDSLQQLNQFLLQNPKFAIKMVHILAERLAKTDEMLKGKVSDETRVSAVENIREKKPSASKEAAASDSILGELDAL